VGPGSTQLTVTPVHVSVLAKPRGTASCGCRHALIPWRRHDEQVELLRPQAWFNSLLQQGVERSGR
jgi:hypothetical protein